MISYAPNSFVTCLFYKLLLETRQARQFCSYTMVTDHIPRPECKTSQKSMEWSYSVCRHIPHTVHSHWTLVFLGCSNVDGKSTAIMFWIGPLKIQKGDSIKEYMAAREQAFIPDTILKAWEKSSIHPHNPNIFTDTNFAPSASTSSHALMPANYPSSCPLRYDSNNSDFEEGSDDESKLDDNEGT